MKVITDANDPGYFEMRATELISEARQCVATVNENRKAETGDVETETQDPHGTLKALNAAHMARYHECLKNAISLLALARLARTEN